MSTPELLGLIDVTIAEYEQWLDRKQEAEARWSRRYEARIARNGEYTSK